jgi:hypothetical protein
MEGEQEGTTHEGGPHRWGRQGSGGDQNSVTAHALRLPNPRQKAGGE